MSSSKIYAAISLVSAFLTTVFWLWVGDVYVTSVKNKYEGDKLNLEQAFNRERQTLTERVQELDSSYSSKLKEANDANEKLAADLAADRKRVYVNAVCTTGGDKGTSNSSRVGNGKECELTGEARQNYLALRSGIAQVEAQLGACQDYVRSLQQGVGDAH